MNPKFCAQCGAELPGTGVKFCPQCGKSVGTEIGAAASTETPRKSPLVLETEARELLKAGKFIDAIVLYRKETGISLKEGKEKIQELIRKYNIPPPPLPPWSKRLRNRAIVSAVLALPLAAVVANVLPHLSHTVMALACERLPAAFCRPFLVVYAAAFVVDFLLISILRAFSGNIPPLWKDAGVTHPPGM